MRSEPPTPHDADIVTAQLGRPPRDLVGVAHRCPCGNPDVVATSPRLADGTPFPTYYYLTCPVACSEIGTLEAQGLMRQMNERLGSDPVLAQSHRRAHEAYVRDRSAHGDVPEIARQSAGGMPERVKCLHALVAHSLAAGPGVNPLGDEALSSLPPWWEGGPCVRVDEVGPHPSAPPAAGERPR